MGKKDEGERLTSMCFMKGLSRFNTTAGIEPAIAIFLERIQTIYSINYTFIQCLSLSKVIPTLCPHSTVNNYMISKQAVNHTEIRHFERFGSSSTACLLKYFVLCFDIVFDSCFRFRFRLLYFVFLWHLFLLSFIYSFFLCEKRNFEFNNQKTSFRNRVSKTKNRILGIKVSI